MNTAEGTILFGETEHPVVFDLRKLQERKNEIHEALCNTRRIAPPDSLSVGSTLVESLTMKVVPNYGDLDDIDKKAERETTLNRVRSYLATESDKAMTDASNVALLESIFKPRSNAVLRDYIKLPKPPQTYWSAKNTREKNGLPTILIQDVAGERMVWYATHFIEAYPEQFDQFNILVIQARKQAVEEARELRKRLDEARAGLENGATGEEAVSEETGF